MSLFQQKVGNGFAFLLYYAAIIGLALLLHAKFEAFRQDNEPTRR